MSPTRAFAVAFIVIILIGSIYSIYSNAFQSLDHLFMDSFFFARGRVAPSGDIVIVALDRESAAKMQRKTTTWQRKDFALAITNLTAAGVDLIGIDYIFSIPDSDPTQDEAMESALQDSANVILASDISGQKPVVPLERFRVQEVGEGFINLFPERDAKIRRTPPLRLTTGAGGEFQFDLPFSFQMALLHLYPQGDFEMNLNEKGRIRLGDLRIPYSGNRPTDGMWVNYCGPSGTFPVLSIVDVLRNEFDPSAVKGKIALMGNMNPLERDYYPVPFSGFRDVTDESKEWNRHSMDSMFGIEIHANAVHTLLSRSLITPVPLFYQILHILILGFVSSWIPLSKRWSGAVSAALLLAIMALYWICSFILFRNGWLLPPAALLVLLGAILLTGVIAKQLEEAAEKRYVTGLFGKYVSPGIVSELIKDQDLIHLRGRRQQLTIFFSDIRGFTSLSERLPPEEVSSLLNEYFRRMTDIVFRHGGTLDKFIGDAVMAFFGNPVAYEDHAERAVRMALEMREEVEKLTALWKSQGKAYDFEIGMGISTGEVVVGNLGSDNFFDYTVIGDDVNLASRLQGLAVKNQIIISEKTYQVLGGKFEVAPMDPVHVKGKTQPVQIFQVLRAL